jgi:hypothetical protein
MLTFPPSYTYANSASEKSPRFVIGIIFDTASIYMTSHSGIANVPGTVISNVLKDPSAVSQKIYPLDGRSEIGSMSFDVVDIGTALTSAFYNKLINDLHGLRGKTVVFYQGYSGADFSQYQLYQTQVIKSVSYSKGVYSFQCSDISREARRDIFDPKRTTLASTVSATDTTIPCVTTTGFQRIAHGPSWSDSPSTTVGYIRIDDEVIRYTGATSTDFTGCTRGVLNTRAVPHAVDVSTPVDQRTKVEEFIYLEMPAVSAIYAILTGIIYSDGATAGAPVTIGTLPAHWSLGISTTWVKVDDFINIGADLWTTTSDLVSFIARFAGLKKTDGKKFLETELYQLLGCFPIIYADGRIGIKRMNAVLVDAPYVAALDESNVVSWSSLKYDMESMFNSYRVNWNFNKDDTSTRAVAFVDTDSIALHGETDVKTFEFRGLYGSRHTDSLIRDRINALRDRYSHPPALMTLTLLPSMNVLQVGDIVRVKLPLVRDYVDGGQINRSFEVQKFTTNHATGAVTAELFGSTGRASSTPISTTGGQGPLGQNEVPDAFYNGTGTALTSVMTITPVSGVGVIATGIHTITGNADMTASAAVYYYLGDLTLPDGAEIHLVGNVQLRVRGFFTVNGIIDGIGGGLAGVSDTSGFGTSALGQAGFGSTRGMDGISVSVISSRAGTRYQTLAAKTTVGKMQQIPSYNLTLVSGTPPTITGLPTDLRGTSGGAGGKIIQTMTSGVAANGGAGAAGGAGLVIICRGMDIGVSGYIVLDGANSATPSPVTWTYGTMYPGAGGGGAPGALLILLDGSGVSLPDLSGGLFSAATGSVGYPAQNTMTSPSGGANPWLKPWQTTPPEGYADPAMISGVNLSNSAYRIQYIAGLQTAVADTPSAVPPATALSTAGAPSGVLITLTLPAFDQFDSVKLFAATTNNRTGATQVAEFKATSFVHSLATGTTRFYWVELGRGSLVSTWFPVSSTAGVSGTAA